MKKILAGSAKYLEQSEGIRKLDYLMLNFQFLCNYRCTKCCNLTREKQCNNPLSIDEIKNLIKQSAKLGMRVLVIAGEGEPLLYPSIKQVIQTAQKLGMIPYIFTNGSMLKKPMVNFLKNNGASLIINCDSMEESQYEQLSGLKGSYHTLMENLSVVRRSFVDSQESKEGYEVRRVAINTVVSKMNYTQIPKVIDFCGEDFAFVLNRPINIGKAKNNPQFESLEQVEKVLLEYGQQAPLGKTSDGKWCAYMRNGVSVGSEGDILTCAYSLESAGKFGNIREKPLKEFISAANKAVDSFYSTEKSTHCILRHPNYKKFLEML